MYTDLINDKADLEALGYTFAFDDYADLKIGVLEKEIEKLKNVAHPPVIALERIKKIEEKLDMIEVVEIIDDRQSGDA